LPRYHACEFAGEPRRSEKSSYRPATMVTSGRLLSRYRSREGIRVTHQSQVRVIARITGRVQGVKYRATARREARQRGLTGWVRNEPDGAVLIEVEGDPAAVDEFLDWCVEGPPGARVATVETTVAEPAGYAEFTILRSERQ
jgi:acylphosphatase